MSGHLITCSGFVLVNNNNNNSNCAYHYTITPSNFVTLPEAKQRKKIGEFFDLLRVIQRPIKIRLTRKILPVPVDGRTVGMPILQLYISSHEPLNRILEALRYEYTTDLGGHKDIRIIRENWRDVTVDLGDGAESVAKCFTLRHIPHELPWAWVATGIFPVCHEITMWIEPVLHQNAVKYIRKRKELVYESATRSRAAAQEYEKLERAEESVRQTHAGLFRCRIICVIAARNRKELGAAVREFRNAAGISGGIFSTQIAKQAAMYSRGWGMTLVFDLGSMSCLYPMVSGDMLEVPNGLVLGINTDSAAPVIFDFQKRTNYNVAIIGTSGSGKSFTAKMFLRRLLAKYPDSLCFVIDPMGEYYDIAESLGLDRIQITGHDAKLGFDPFKLLEPADAADILGNVTRAPEDVIKQFRKYSDKVGSIDELFHALKGNPESQKWLDDLVDGPLAQMMRGTPSISDRLVISMKKADGKPHEIMLLILALNKVWKRIEEMPQNTQKIVVLDEAWMLFKMEGAGKYIEQIVRMGRKRNVKFLFISQNIDDIAKDRGGASKIVDNMETKILLNMEEDATDSAARILGLSPQEASRIKSFEPGHAIMLTKKYRLHVKFEPSGEEKAMFETSPQQDEKEAVP